MCILEAVKSIALPFSNTNRNTPKRINRQKTGLVRKIVTNKYRNTPRKWRPGHDAPDTAPFVGASRPKLCNPPPSLKGKVRHFFACL